MNKPGAFVEGEPDERSLLIGFILSYTNPEIGEFLLHHGLPKSGTKQDLRTRISGALDEGLLSNEDILEFLDEREPWGKQHVYLLKGPRNLNRRWRDFAFVDDALTRAGVGALLNNGRQIALPEDLTLTRIEHAETRLAATAISRRDGYSRRPEFDYTMAVDESTFIEYRAFVREIVRNTIRFEWDLVRNQAMVQVTQLPSGHAYESVYNEFADLVQPWLDLSQFTDLDLRKAIEHLHEEQEAGSQETRVSAIDYQSIGGRTLAAKSGTEAASLFGEAVIDNAMRDLRNNGVGRTGNFYWLPAADNPLVKEVHVHIWAAMNRVNITKSHSEEVIRHVVGRIRHHCS